MKNGAGGVMPQEAVARMEAETPLERERERMLSDIGRRLSCEIERQGISRESWRRRVGLSKGCAAQLVRGSIDARLSTLLRAAVGLGLKLTVSVKRPDSADTAAPEREGS